MQAVQPLPVVLSLTALIDGLLEAVAARYGVFPIRGPLMLFLWKRFTQVKQRFANIAARFAAGKGFRARPARPRTARAPRPPRDEHAFRIRVWVTPKFGWLCRIASESIGAGAFAYALRDLLTNDPEMLALLAATPATARALRPLCHMLGVPLPPPPVVLSASPREPFPESTRVDAAARPNSSAAKPRTTAVSEPPRAENPPPDPPVAVCSVGFFNAA